MRDREHLALPRASVELFERHGAIRRPKIDSNAELRMSHSTEPETDVTPCVPDIRPSNGGLIQCASSKARDFPVQ